MQKIILIVLILIFLTGGYLFFINRVEIRGNFDLWYRKTTLPPAQEFKKQKRQDGAEIKNSDIDFLNKSDKDEEKNNAATILKDDEENKAALKLKEKNKLSPSVDSQGAATASTTEANKKLPTEINLDVPFVSQAPLKNWDATHEEACEEASVLMVNGFYKGEKYARQEMEDNLQKIITWEKEKFGFFEDTTAEETARILREYFGLTGATVYYDITVEDIKRELAAGRPVIVPAAGKILPNPYFRNGGPLYHMLVLKGYTKDGKFISNDPGTNTLGENFTYKFDDLYNAIHDWRADKDILKGRKAMIVVE